MNHPVGTAPFPSKDPYDWVTDVTAVDPERVAIIDCDDRRLSYREVDEGAAKFAAALRAFGVGFQDRVLVQAEKSVDFILLYLACLRSGFIFVPLNTGYTDRELDYFIADSDPRLIVCSPGKVGDFETLSAGRAPVASLGINHEGSLVEAAQTAASAPCRPHVDNDRLAAFLYTSGTTGRPKGAMLTCGNFTSNAATLVDVWRFTPQDVLLHALPLFHAHGLFVAVNTVLAAGAALRLLLRFDAAAVLRLLPQSSVFMGVPTYYARLLSDPGLDRHATAAIRLFVSGSAPLLAETHQAFAARTDQAILERYGMTETLMNTSNPYDGERRPGTVGLPLPGVEIRITMPGTAAQVTNGTVGMIEVRGPNVFKGYWRNDAKTAEDLRPDGFFVTGDLGVIDVDGYVQIVGRGKDLIISGGYNVYPREVEVELDALPGVAESAVIGVPHPDFGEAVVAVLVPHAGIEIDTVAVAEALGQRLARYKLPKAYAISEALPRNTMGKVMKSTLRADWAKAD